MKRLLFVDTLSQFGHNNFNRVLIKRFHELGFEIELVMREGYYEELRLPRQHARWPLPARWFPDNPGKLRARYCQLRMLLHIKKQLAHREYDFIVFSFFDEISLYFSGLRGNLFLICHANISGLRSPVKRFFLKQVATRGRLVVFHDFIKQRCEKYGISNVLVEPQGLPTPYAVSRSTQARLLRAIDERLDCRDFAHTVFAPTGSKYSDGLLKEAIGTPRFVRFLEEKRIAFVIKDATLRSNCDNIVAIARHLSDQEYQALFLSSSSLVLSYPPSFDFRVSAILFECFSNNEPCVLSDIPGFRVFERHFNYTPFFRGTAGLMAALDTVCSLAPATRQAPYRDRHLLNPAFATLTADPRVSVT